jgi:hypothetical protein
VWLNEVRLITLELGSLYILVRLHGEIGTVAIDNCHHLDVSSWQVGVSYLFWMSTYKVLYICSCVSYYARLKRKESCVASPAQPHWQVCEFTHLGLNSA